MEAFLARVPRLSAVCGENQLDNMAVVAVHLTLCIALLFVKLLLYAIQAILLFFIQVTMVTSNRLTDQGTNWRMRITHNMAVISILMTRSPGPQEQVTAPTRACLRLLFMRLDTALDCITRLYQEPS